MDQAAGKRIKFSGYIKTEAIRNGYAGLWWRADANLTPIVFENMDRAGPDGTSNWRSYELELSIPREADKPSFRVRKVR